MSPSYKRPKLAIIANGDELIEPGQTATLGSVISSNPYGLAPLIEAWGADAIFTNICKDDPKVIRACIEGASDADILLPIGGASVGDRDYMRSVFSKMGFVQAFAKVAVKPGKPVWFGKLGTQYVLGLPGNPASALGNSASVFKAPNPSYERLPKSCPRNRPRPRNNANARKYLAHRIY